MAKRKLRRLQSRNLKSAAWHDVSIDHRGKGGTLHIKYKDLDQLDTVLKKLNR
jgi:ParB family transcriptional regulator, chromosome partitioning protein